MELLTVSLIVATAGFLVYYILRWMSHFERLGVEYETPWPILGNMWPIILRRRHIAVELSRLYKKFSDRKYFGFYDCMNPSIVIRDPELVTLIAVKNFDSFVDHRSLADERLDPMMAGNLFSLQGDRWREMRKLLSPAFTSSKMKLMYGLMCDCAENFGKYLHRDCQGGKEVNLRDAFNRYTTDVIASCAFGINVDSMRDPNNEFYVLGKKAMTFDALFSLKFLLNRNFSFLVRLLNIRMINHEVMMFFTNIVESTVKLRDETGLYRPDMIQLMMETRGKSNAPKLTTEEMTAQAFVFFLAGFDTSATFQCLLAHVLALNPEVQEKLREEIKDVLQKREGRPTYEDIQQMKYMDAVITETLRFYPVPAFLDRVCVKEFELPPAAPGAKPVTLKPKDTVLFIPFPMHHDPQYYPNPDKFDPDRFLDSVTDPSFYLAFGIGPRICIGNRFALLETKLMAFHLLSNCTLEICDRTTVTVDFDKSNIQLVPRTGFWLRFRSLDQPLISLKNDNCETVTSNGKACSE